MWFLFSSTVAAAAAATEQQRGPLEEQTTSLTAAQFRHVAVKFPVVNPAAPAKGIPGFFDGVDLTFYPRAGAILGGAVLVHRTESSEGDQRASRARKRES